MSRILKTLSSKLFNNFQRRRNSYSIQKIFIPVSICGIGISLLIRNKKSFSTKNYSLPIVLAKSSSDNIFMDTENVIDSSLSGIVKVETPYGSITGHLIDSGGFIITHPLILQTETVVKIIYRDNTTAQATVVAIDDAKGLALLKASNVSKQAKPLQFELERNNLHVGEEILSIGYRDSLNPSATRGIISGIRQGLGFPLDPEFLYIQTDAPCHDGTMESRLSSSGFIILNSEGKIIAVNPLVYKNFRFALSAEHVSEFYNRAKTKLPQLKASNQNTFLMLRNPGALYATCRYHGLQMISLNNQVKSAIAEIDEELGSVKGGVYILSVLKDSRADRDGFLPGDVIVSVNGQAVSDSESMSNFVNNNQKLLFRVARRGEDGYYSKPLQISAEFL